MRYPTSCSWFSAAVTVALATTIATGIAPSVSADQASSMDQAIAADEPSITSDQELPLDAMGYLGGLFEARFHEPHSTTDDPRDEIIVGRGLGNDDVNRQGRE